ncbi:MAG: hypothetical protein ACLPUO_20945 [Streptosporangiaceae bacterium]|jgi:hypothetical protein
MFPYALEQLASQRSHEIQVAADARRDRRGPRAPRHSVRHRAGWSMIELGLRLASQPSRD